MNFELEVSEAMAQHAILNFIVIQIKEITNYLEHVIKGRINREIH